MPSIPEASTVPEVPPAIEQNEQPTLGDGDASQDKTLIKNKKKIPTNVTIVLVGSLALFVALLLVGLYAFKNKNLSQDSIANEESNQGDFDSSEMTDSGAKSKDEAIGFESKARDNVDAINRLDQKKPISFHNRQYVFNPEATKIDSSVAGSSLRSEKYEYVWRDRTGRGDDMTFEISLSNYSSYDSEGMRDFFKGYVLTEDRNNEVVVRDWQDELNDEYILYTSFSLEDHFMHSFSYISNDGRFIAHADISSEDEYTEEYIDFMIREFRRAASIAKGDYPDTLAEDSEIRTMFELEDSKIKFRFDREDFVYDTQSVLYEGNAVAMYSPKEESRKSFKNKIMMIIDTSKEPSEEICDKQLKDFSLNEEISGVNFRGPGECDFLSRKNFDYDNESYIRYSWMKIIDGGEYLYLYTINKKSSDELPFYVIDKITDEFKQFEYKERFQ
ncbi:MAG TPA: hypothetical protein GX706_02605 [Candidatus Moranbacteria bacterium]|nr:hypothetical protein [Candidatus Moranbacteria bacterium]